MWRCIGGYSLSSEFENLNAKANQSSFARLVGVSQTAIKSHFDKGTLIAGQSLADWLHQYCESLRTEAAGRGGDDQKSLTRARTNDAQQSARLKEIQIAEKLGELISAEEIKPAILAMVSAARIELLSLPSKLAAEFKALYGVDVDESLIEDHIHESLEHLSGGMPENT